MIKTTTKEFLKTSKNLLAFSAGIDSTALFFLLKDAEIPFDIAIVDYALRDQSKEEVAYAQELAKRYHKKCFLQKSSKISTNFEATARKIRYAFFEELIALHHYENLLTAHHLGDRLEWFLMQFCKGAGCVELSGMQEIEQRERYRLIRPLLDLDKEELLSYLENNNIIYFQDTSNSDEKYKRNYFRKHYTIPLLQKYKNGIQKSFYYIDKDKELLVKEALLEKRNALACFKKKNSRSDIYTVDKYLKTQGHLLTHKERRLLEESKSVVVGRKFIVTQIAEYICIAPYIKVQKLTKTFKEKMRKAKIDPKLRAYLSSDPEAEAFLSSLLA